MLTRKEFLQTLGTAALSAAITQNTNAEPSAQRKPQQTAGEQRSTRPGKVKRGVTFYCYQDDYKLREMNLEDCVAAVADLGADGIEILG